MITCSHRVEHIFPEKSRGWLEYECIVIFSRPNITGRARYYGICFLSQILLDDDDDDLAGKLIRIFVGFFKACVKKGELDTKMMSALLSGVNRAYPYSKLSSEKLQEQVSCVVYLLKKHKI